MIQEDNWGYYDDSNISMCGCSARNRLTDKELEERHRNLSKSVEVRENNYE